MNCQQYLFKLTSGQLQDAPASERMQAALHCLVCRQCRDFARNDAALGQMLHAWRDHLRNAADDGTAAVAKPPSAPPPSSTP